MHLGRGITPDSRIRKSRQAVCAALFQLLEKDSFTGITVNDICKAARVSRTTFYQHFQDKYDLMRFALEQATDELRRASAGSAEREIHNLLDFVQKNQQVFRHLNEQNEELFYLLNEVSITSLNEYLESTSEIPVGNRSRLHSVFLAGGRAWVLLWWIKTGCRVPREELEEYLLSMLRP